MRRSALSILPVQSWGLMFGAPAAYDAAGSLDSTFGQRGKVLRSLSNCGFSICNANSEDALLQPDGKLVVATTLQTSSEAMRCLPNGSLDTSFGNGRIAQTALSTSGVVADSVALQPAGEIVIAGHDNRFLVARYSSDGSADTSFGTGGLVSTNIGHLPSAVAVIREPKSRALCLTTGVNCTEELPHVPYDRS